MEEEERAPKRRKMTDDASETSHDKATGIHAAPQSFVHACKPAQHSPLRPASPLETSDPEDLPASDNEEYHAQHSNSVYPTTTNSSDPPISKSQLKRLQRNQAWEAGREYRKERRKEKIQAKRRRKKAARAAEVTNEGDGFVESADAPPANQLSLNGPSTKDSLIDDSPPNGPPMNGISNNWTSAVGRPGKKEHRRAVQLPVTLILDCGFDDLMLPKELISLGSQLTRAYSDNAKAKNRAHLVVSSFRGKLKERFDTVLARQHEGWKFVKFTEDSFVEASESAASMMRGDRGGSLAGAFESLSPTDQQSEGEVVYLTSDSPDTLETLRPNSTYIIGGLVDKNRHKGICYKTAMDNGVKTAKLPIGEYMRMNSRYVLATNHVVEIMLRWLECGDWGEAFERVVPKRKGGVLKGKEGEGEGMDSAEANKGQSRGSKVENANLGNEEQDRGDESETSPNFEREAEDRNGIEGDQ